MRHCLTLLAAACVLAPAAHAQSSVTIYGRADAGIDVTTTASGHDARVLSGGWGGSRLGFTGSEDLGGGLRAVFRLEQGLNLDDGTLGQGGRVFGREATVGLASANLGTVTLGRNPTPVFYSHPWVDAFAWSGAGALVALTRNTAGVSRQITATPVNGRTDNSVSYLSPKLGDLVLRAHAAVGEGSAAFGRAYGASARYTAGAVDVLAAANHQKGAGNANGIAKGFVAGGSYNFQVVKLFAGYTLETNDCSTCTGALARGVGASKTEYQLVNVGVRVPFGRFTGLAQVTRVSDKSTYTAATGDRDATWVAVGADYALSKRTTLHSSIGSIGNKNGSNYVLGGGAAQQPATVAADPSRSTTVNMTVSHAF